MGDQVQLPPKLITAYNSITQKLTPVTEDKNDPLFGVFKINSKENTSIQLAGAGFDQPQHEADSIA